MKKLISTFMLILALTTVSFAQKSNVSKAKNAISSDTPDFKAAREAIKLALADPTTMNEANTWYIAGLIGYNENDSYYKLAVLNKDYDKDAKGKAILESYDYFLKAYELDQKPDEKGKVKPKFTKDIKTKITEYYKTQSNLVAYGAYLYDKKDYKNTVKAFDTYLAIPKLPMMNNEIATNDSTYKMIKYYDAYAAKQAAMPEKAIELLNSLKNDNYEGVSVYQLLYEQYFEAKDTLKGVDVLKEGVQKFPNESWFIQNLINYYIFTSKYKDAIVYLDNAISQDPKSSQYHYAKGNMEEQLLDYDQALAEFNKAIELDPTYSDAYYGTGRLYYNKAVKQLEQADKIKDIKKSNDAKKQVDDLFKQSIPFFKKAIELKPTDIEVKKALRTVYYRLNMDAEWDAINKEIKAAN